LGGFSEIWNNTHGQFCIGLKDGKHLGIDIQNWPGGRQIANDLYYSVGNIADTWHKLENQIKHRQLWNCIQINMGNINRQSGSLFAPQFHLDDQLLYSPIFKGKNYFSGIVALTLQGTNGICFNKRYWFNELIPPLPDATPCTVKNFEESPQQWAHKLFKWGYAKIPGSVYGVFGMSTWYWQHSVLTTNALAKIKDEYNKILIKNNMNKLILKDSMFKKNSWTALFRCLRYNKK